MPIGRGRRKYAPYLFGPLPVPSINRALGTELDIGDVTMSIRARNHVRANHPEDFARCFPHVAAIISAPLYVGDDFRNLGKIELVGRPLNFPEWLLVAVDIRPDGKGNYNILSFYPISSTKVEGRRANGRYKIVLPE